MRIFLDANVLVSVLNKEYPLFSYSSRILSLADDKNFEVYTSPICLAIAFYFAQKKNKKSAKQKISVLGKKLRITPVTEKVVQLAVNDPKVHDVEDGLEYYAAKESKCVCILTEDTKDFYFSTLEVLDCRRFFEKYLANPNPKAKSPKSQIPKSPLGPADKSPI